jgi:hypothetical protein
VLLGGMLNLVLAVEGAVCGAVNPTPSTLNPKPEARNPKPETRNPKPETRTTPESWKEFAKSQFSLKAQGVDFCATPYTALGKRSTPSNTLAWKP